MNRKEKIKRFIIKRIVLGDEPAFILYLLSGTLFIAITGLIYMDDQSSNLSIGFILFVVTITPVLYFCHLVLYYYIHGKYHRVARQTLPLDYLLDASWVDFATAINHGTDIAYYINDEQLQTIVGNTMKRIRSNMFYTDSTTYGLHNDDEEWDTLDKENTILWTSKLSCSPLLERTSVLLQMDTSEKQKAFAQIEKDELIEFFKPYIRFVNYVNNIHNNRDFRTAELNKQNTISKRDIVEKEVKAIFDFGMKNMWTPDPMFDNVMNTVKKPKTAMDLIDEKLLNDDFYK